MLETAFSQFSDEAHDLFVPLIEERDTYMAARLWNEIENNQYRHLLAVIGAGHLNGITKHLQRDVAPAGDIIQTLDQVPPPGRWLKLFPWLIVTLIVGGFIIGFVRSPELGWHLVLEWVLINGTLSALGALIAAAHPLTVIGAFVAAPLTSLNPTVSAGMVTAAIETYLRKPNVGDFGRLRTDTTHLKGWWRNKVARILLVFVLSTVGSAIGTYVAGFRIFDLLT
jgi:pheromone shutdown-related protein TraB